MMGWRRSVPCRMQKESQLGEEGGLPAAGEEGGLPSAGAAATTMAAAMLLLLPPEEVM